jgi:DNA (cytosine-5)-methyltransferase 1
VKLLDLFCGAGGCSMGYHRAGFEVVGVDIKPQKHYPFEFHQADALEYLAEHGAEFDVMHASPPCQAYSAGSRMRTGNSKNHPKLIEPVRELLIVSGKTYVIENVVGAPLINPILLCGSMFGLRVRRHRLFETNIFILSKPCEHSRQSIVIGVYGDHAEDSCIRKGHPARRAKDMDDARDAMGIDWMETWHEIKEAIPPAYTEWIGKQIMEAMK